MAAWSAGQKVKGQSGRLPAPLPTDFHEAAKLWTTWYQQSRRHCEQTQQTTYGLIDPYITRLKTTAAAFLRMTDKERRFLRAGIEDGVQWLGERMDIYADIYGETMRMREMGVEAYRTEALENMNRKLGWRLPITGIA
jgi:hypothetical protein